MKSTHSYWERRYSSKGEGTAASVLGDPEHVNQRAKARFANIVLREIEELDIEVNKATALSVGAGTGLVSERIAEEVNTLFGVDFSRTAIYELMNQPHTGQYAVASASSIPCKEPFDIVSAFSILYHIVEDEEWRDSISELARLTKTGGYLLCRINWNSQNMGDKDSHFYSRSREIYKKTFRQNSLVLEDVIDLPVQPRGFQFLSRIPAGGIAKRIVSPLILSAELWDNHQNKLVILRKET